MKLLTIGLIAAGALFAQSEPQFTWEGTVDRMVVLRLQGTHLDVSDGKGTSLDQQHYEFRNPLPDSWQKIRVERREGRGAVLVTQQPSIENRYTAEITMEDRQSGESHYRIEAFWDVNRGGYRGVGPKQNWGGRRDRLSWSARVNGEVTVECRAQHCESVVQSGLPVSHERVKFPRPIPENAQVILDETKGRGDIRIVEQPSARNGYAVRVLIRARGGEAGEQGFQISWPRLREK